MAEFVATPEEALLRRQDVERLTRLGRNAIYERLNPKSPRYDKDFPKPITVGSTSVRWVQSEVQTYIARKIEQSRNSDRQAA